MKPGGYVVRAVVWDKPVYFECQNAAEAQQLVDVMRADNMPKESIRIYVISAWESPK